MSIEGKTSWGFGSVEPDNAFIVIIRELRIWSIVILHGGMETDGIQKTKILGILQSWSIKILSPQIQIVIRTHNNSSRVTHRGMDLSKWLNKYPRFHVYHFTPSVM